MATPDYTPEELATEEWRPVPNCIGYDVSSLGRARSWMLSGNRTNKFSPTPKILVLSLSGPDKRPKVTFGRKNSMFISRAVLSTFVGPCPVGMEACHNDGNFYNNRLYNLRWDTHKSNEHDKITHGTTIRGERNGMAKLTVTDISSIRQLYVDGKSVSVIAKMYGVLHPAIVRIVTGQRWKHTEGPIHEAGEHRGTRMPKGKDNYFGQHPEISRGEANHKAILTNESVVEIRHKYAEGEKAKTLALHYGVGVCNVYHIVHGISWKHIGGPITP